MPSPNKSPINHSQDDPCDQDESGDIDEKPASAEFGADQLARIADLVARGEMPVPQQLSAEQLHRLVREVRERRRKRLVKCIARAIAVDIHTLRTARKE